MKKILLVFRKPHQNVFSIEYLFNNIHEVFKLKTIPVDKVTLPWMSSGLVNRIRNTVTLLKHRNQIIHITGDVYYTVLGALFCKRVITIHDLSFIDRSQGLAKAILKLFWVSLPCRFAHVITVVSEATKKEILKQVAISPDKIKVIYNFIDGQYIPPLQVKAFNRTQPRILQIGTAFNKNIERLTKALKGRTCHLVIIGRLNETIITLLKEAGISFENKSKISQEELYQEYTQADFLAYASIVEGFGLPILEAQSVGLPVLTSNCSSMPEIAGEAAIFVDPFSVESIRQGVETMIENEALREDIKQKGFENVKRFSKEKIAEDYLEVYRGLGLEV